MADTYTQGQTDRQVDRKCDVQVGDICSPSLSACVMINPISVVTQVVVFATSSLSLWTNGCVVTSLVRYSQLRHSNDNLYLGSMAAVNMFFSVYAVTLSLVSEFTQL